MPFYEYECSACKFYVEALQKISDAPLRKCPSCGKQALKKLVSAPVFRLKGGGWYETDFKSDKEEKRNLAGKEEAAESKADDAKKEAGETKAADTKAVDAKAEPKAQKPAKPVSKPVGKVSKPRPKAKSSARKKKTGRR